MAKNIKDPRKVSKGGCWALITLLHSFEDIIGWNWINLDLIDSLLEHRFEALFNKKAADAGSGARCISWTSVVLTHLSVSVLRVPLSEGVRAQTFVWVLHLLSNYSHISARGKGVFNSHITNNFIAWANWDVSPWWCVSTGFSCVNVSIDVDWLHPSEAVEIVTSVW